VPLPLPKLDDRRWKDLVDEGRALIPRHAPQWTDHNVHDPGITLLELFAWLTETTVYRLDRIPEAHRRKFLELLGYVALPPRASHAMLAIDAESGTAPFLLPERSEFEAVDSDGLPVRFRTLRDLTAAPMGIRAIQVEDGDASGVPQVRDRTPEMRAGLAVTLFALDHPPGTLYVGFSTVPTEVPIALGFHFRGPGNDRSERTRIAVEADAQRAACRPVLPHFDCCDGSNDPDDGAPTPMQHHSALLSWEFYTGAPGHEWEALKVTAGPQRPAVGEVRDDTRALSLDGVVELNLPNTLATVALGEVSQPLLYVRSRLAAGQHDAPPALLDIAPSSVEVEQATAFARTLTIAAGVDPTGPAPTPGSTSRFNLVLDDNDVAIALDLDPPGDSAPPVVVLGYEAPTATATGRITFELAMLARGSGAPNQRVSVAGAPLQLESLALHTHHDQQWETWTRRETFDGSRRTDLHFVLDATSGVVTFGDGERGRTPPAGCILFARFRTTRADKGNVSAGRITRLADSARNTLWLSAFAPAEQQALRTLLSTHTTNRTPATGGAAAESLTSATGRAVEVVHAHERLRELASDARAPTIDQLDRAAVSSLMPPARAVNLMDIERLALDVPGTRVARARAWPSIHPAYPCLTAPGVVTVVIVPDQPVERPTPTAGLLLAIRKYLDRRRPLTMRIEVVGPEYLEVSVQAGVRVKRLADPALVRERIRAAIDRFLDPRNGGPNGHGWPFGRNVYRSEILQLIDGVVGVDHVESLTLRSPAGDVLCSNIPLCPIWLATPGSHAIEIVRGAE
jgi:hypothetical protein